MKRANVGSSHMRPMNSSARCSGARVAARPIFRATLSSTRRDVHEAPPLRLPRPRPPSEAAHVEGEDRDDEQEEEDGDRRAEAEVVDAAERCSPHGECDHVRVVLHRAGRDGEDDVEDLEDVDQHRDEDDAEHGREQRHGDAAEDLPLRRTVGPCCFERVARDRGKPAAITTIEKPAQTQM